MDLIIATELHIAYGNARLLIRKLHIRIIQIIIVIPFKVKRSHTTQLITPYQVVNDVVAAESQQFMVFMRN